MPVSLEQWRSSVGSNNAARSHVIEKRLGKKSPKNLLGQFQFLLALFFLGITNNKGVSCTVVAPVLTKCHGSVCKGNWGRCCWQLICLAFSISVAVCLLSRSGDVESNPGPPELFDLVPDNLRKVCDLVSDAKTKWFDLGFQLHIKEVDLDVIKMENDGDVQACFRKMLSTWLKMIDPPPSWEGLLTALEHHSVKRGDLAVRIRLLLKQPERSTTTNKCSSSQAGETMSERSSSQADETPPPPSAPARAPICAPERVPNPQDPPKNHRTTLNEYCQKKGVSQRDEFIEDHSTGQPKFKYTITCLLEGSKIVQDSGQYYPRKDAAKEVAASKILAKIKEREKSRTHGTAGVSTGRGGVVKGTAVSPPNTVWKSQLKEHYDKQGKAGMELKYKTSEVAGGGFVASIFISELSKEVRGERGNNKKEAEQNAAKKAVQQLQQRKLFCV